MNRSKLPRRFWTIQTSKRPSTHAVHRIMLHCHGRGREFESRRPPPFFFCHLEWLPVIKAPVL